MLAGCGAPGDAQIDSLIALQPQVESVIPQDGSIVAPDATVEILFTKSVLPDTLGRSSLAIIAANQPDDLEGVVNDVLDGDVEGLEGLYEVLDGGRRTLFRPLDAFEEGASYLVVATPRILGEGLLPLNQQPGRAPQPFVSGFGVATDPNGDVASGVAGGDGSTGAMRVRPSFLVIDELLYDAVGSDTDGDVFVELYGEAGGDMTGYQLVFVNGEDGVIKDTIELPDGSIVPDDGIFVIADAKTGLPGISDVEGADYVLNFDPQNGPDCLQLLNEKGTFLDALGYGESIVDIAENGLPCFEGSTVLDVSSGQSLSRIAGGDSDENATDFETLIAPTPGQL
jgi:hypothetical protein